VQIDAQPILGHMTRKIGAMRAIEIEKGYVAMI
jgi:hypothetical protein